MALRETIRHRLLELRRDAGLAQNQSQWALKLGVTKSTADNWMAGPNQARVRRSTPSGEMLLQIATRCGVSLDWLLGREGAPKHLGQTRAGADLYADVAEDVARRARDGAEGQRWARGIPWADLSVGGEAVLRDAAQRLLERLATLAREAERSARAARDAVLGVESPEVHPLSMADRRPRESERAYVQRLAVTLEHARAVARAARENTVRAALVGDDVFGYQAGAREGTVPTPRAFAGTSRPR